ncbi:hypothetical protein K474DRAFT_1709511 [Panus rudis PR-1116 ss-1]|nr:hypothetical protein K474DRAFT_1709511 [Panus rudis PR-1116 ss-1]
MGSRFKIRSFCDFMLSGYPSRLWYLREIIFSKTFKQVTKLVEPLGQILSEASHLDSLEIARCDWFLENYPGLVDAIVSNHHIKSLRLIKAGDQALQFLRRICSPLTSVTVLLTPECVDGPVPSIALGLSKFSKTLLEINVRNFLFAAHLTVYTYPNVTSLTIEESDVRMPVFMPMFPQLRELSIFCFCSRFAPLDDEMDTIHADSKAWQAAQGEATRWRFLERLEGDVHSLFRLAPTCKIRLLSSILTSQNVHRFTQLCRDTQPDTLKVYFHSDKLQAHELEDVIQASSQLRSISITVDAMGMISEMDFSSIFVHFRRMLHLTAVHTLYIRLTYHAGDDLSAAESDSSYAPDSDDEDENGALEDEDDSADEAEEEAVINSLLEAHRPNTPDSVKRYLAGLDVDAVIERCARDIPTLRYACFDKPNSPLAYFEVFRHEDGGTFSWIRLSHAVGEKIMANLC